MSKAWIKTVWQNGSLTGYCLVRKDPPLVDSDILDHFDLDYSGKEIKETAEEFHGVKAENVEWGSPYDMGDK